MSLPEVELDYEDVSDEDSVQVNVGSMPKFEVAQLKSVAPFNDSGTPVQLLEQTEYESSIRLPLLVDQYTDLMNRWRHGARAAYVLYFANGVRMTQVQGAYTYQHKKMMSMDRVLYVAKNQSQEIQFVPLVRTAAHEVPAFRTELATVTKIIVRYVVEASSLHDGAINFRYALEQTCSNEHFLACEVEYPHGYLAVYDDIVKLESHLVTKMFELLDPHHDTSPIWSNVGFEELIRIPSRKFYPLHANVLANKFNVVVKLDGHKGRLLLRDSDMMLYDDLMNVRVLRRMILNAPKNLVLQFEHLAQGQAQEVKLVVTDVLGMFLNGQLYTPDPASAMDFIQQLEFRATCLEHEGVLYTFDKQKYLDARSSRAALAKHKADGFILITSNVLVKWKTPTVDVQLKRGYMYLYDDPKAICGQHFTEPDGVYEVFQPSNSSYTILRERFDRPFASTVAEFQNFLSETAYMNRLVAGLNKS